MSVILITDHNECIYDVKKVEPIIYEKPPQYISKYNSSIKEKSAEKWHNKRHETMGIPEEDLPDPKEFLKKHTGQPAYTRAQLKNETSVVKAKQPNVPTLEECKKDFKKAKSSMNFVNKNIKTVKSMKAKEPVPKVVIDCYGTKKLLAHGMEPVFVKSSMFGKTPMYLKRFMKCREKHEQIEKEIENLEQKKCRYIRKDEREALLNVRIQLIACSNRCV